MKLRNLFALAAAASLPACSGNDACDPDAPNTICTIAGTGEQGQSGNEGPATEAELYVPMDMAVAPNGEVWVLDFNNYMIRSIDADGIMHRIIGVNNGDVGDSPPVGVPSIPAIEATFNHTATLAFSDDGYLYLAAWHNSRVKRVKLSDMMLENYAGRGRRTFYDGDDGPKLDASLDLPAAVTIAPDGEVAIMDQANQVVRKVDAAGNIHRIAGVCIIDDTTQCALDQIPQQCPDSDKLTCGDLATECSKPCTPAYGGDGGDALNARLGQGFGQQTDPTGRIIYDRQGNLLIADTENHRIRKVDAAGIMTTIAGTGTPGYSGDGGLATAAQINHPVDFAIGDDNTIYFSDTNNHCIRKIDPAGTISTVVGVCDPTSTSGAFDGDGGPPTKAHLAFPYGLHINGKKLYVADTYNNRIRVVNLP